MLKRRGWLIGVVLFAVGGGVAVGLTWPWGPAPSPEAAIEVNGQPIASQTFDQAYLSLLSYYRGTLSGEERANFEQQLLGASGAYYRLSLRADVAETLIRRALLEQQAQKLGISVSDAEVQATLKRQLADFLESNGVPADQIQRTLSDPQTLRSDFSRGLAGRIRDRLLEEALRARAVEVTPPTRAQLEAYYQEFRLRYYRPALVRVRRLLIRLPQDPTPQEIEAAQAQLERIKAQLEQGASFVELARAYSQDAQTAARGGELGWIQRGSPMGEDFVELAFSLLPGEVGGPVRTRFGLELVQTLELQPSQGEHLDDVLERVRQDWLEERTAEAFVRWFEDEVYAQAEIDVHLPLVAAYRLEAQDPEAALARYEALWTSGEVDDPYLGYYVARLYHQKLQAAQARLEELAQGAPEREGVLAQIERDRDKVIQGLKDVIAKGRGETALYETLLELDGADHEVRLQYAAYLLGQRERDKAEAQLKQLLAQDPESPQAWSLYGRLLFDAERYAEAAAALREALARWPDDAQDAEVALRLRLARAERRAGDLEAARAAYAELLAQDPQQAEAHRALGEIALEQGDPQGAIVHFRAALEHLPPEAQGATLAQLGRAYRQANQLEAAQTALEKALKAEPPALEAHRTLGEIAEQRGASQEALAHYRRGLAEAVGWPLKEALAEHVLALAPEDVAAHRTLGEIAEQRRRFEEAIAHFQAVLKSEPSMALYRRVGDLFLKLERWEAASEAFHRALALNPSALEAAGLWARLLRLARERAGKAPLGQEGWEALYQLARLSVERAAWEKAGDYLKELQRLAPDYRADEVAKLAQELRKAGVELPES